MSCIYGNSGFAETANDDMPLAVVARWVVTSEVFHPVWRQYMMSLIHLRDIDGYGSATLDFPGATHAVCSVTLDPSKGDFQEGGFEYLVPINFEAQFTAASDTDAQKVLDSFVVRVLNSEMTPESTGLVLNHKHWRHEVRSYAEAMYEKK